MTISEFKAWLEGFEAAMGGNPPSAEQWDAIKAKLAKVSDAPKVAYRDTYPKVWMGRDQIRRDAVADPYAARQR